MSQAARGRFGSCGVNQLQTRRGNRLTWECFDLRWHAGSIPSGVRTGECTHATLPRSIDRLVGLDNRPLNPSLMMINIYIYDTFIHQPATPNWTMSDNRSRVAPVTNAQASTCPSLPHPNVSHVSHPKWCMCCYPLNRILRCNEKSLYQGYTTMRPNWIITPQCTKVYQPTLKSAARIMRPNGIL
jgi:hypothetical protein